MSEELYDRIATKKEVLLMTESELQALTKKFKEQGNIIIVHKDTFAPLAIVDRVAYEIEAIQK